MLLDLTDVLGGWKSCKRTFLSVLGVPFPPTTCKQNRAHSFTDIAAILNGCALNKIKQYTQGGKYIHNGGENLVVIQFFKPGLLWYFICLREKKLGLQKINSAKRTEESYP